MKRGGTRRLRLAALLASLAGGLAAAADRVPVPLYTPALEVPAEAAGSGQAPEVRFRLTVDARGIVTQVDVLEIQPASPFDAVFAAATRAILARWRYAPATHDDQPVATTLQWTAKFPRLDERRTGAGDALAWRALVRRESAALDARARILALPTAQRAKHLIELIEVASKQFAGPVTEAASSRVLAYTDGPKPESARSLANNIEATFTVLQRLLGPGVPAEHQPHRVAAFLYASEHSFESLKRTLGSAEWSAGFYRAPGLVAFPLEMVTNDNLLHAMLHEATHAYLDLYVARPGVTFPRWLDEGLAEYMGSSEIRAGQLLPGRVRRRQVFRGRSEAWGGTSSEQYTLDQVKEALRKQRALQLAQIVGADLDTFYGEQRSMYYPMAWLLVHFLRHGQEDWAQERFPPLVLYVAEGYAPLEALRQFYGDPARLEAAFREYVLAF